MMLRAISIAIYTCIALVVVSMLLVLSSMWSGVEFGPSLVSLVTALIAFMLLSIPGALVHLYQTARLSREQKKEWVTYIMFFGPWATGRYFWRMGA